MTVFAYGYDKDGEMDSGGYWRHSDTLRFRYGYQVGDARPRLVSEESDSDKAVQEAKSAASAVLAQLNELGAPADVSWWVQKGLTTTRTEWSEPQITAVP